MYFTRNSKAKRTDTINNTRSWIVSDISPDVCLLMQYVKTIVHTLPINHSKCQGESFKRMKINASIYADRRYRIAVESAYVEVIRQFAFLRIRFQKLMWLVALIRTRKVDITGHCVLGIVHSLVVLCIINFTNVQII